MPNESKLWAIAEYVRGALEGIQQPAGYWNNVARVRPGHLTVEEIAGDIESPCCTYEIEDSVTLEDERTYDTERATTTVSIRGYRKTEKVGEQWVEDAHREASRLLKDILRAVLSNQGMNCNAERVVVVSPTRWSTVEGAPGWVECVTTLAVLHPYPYTDP